MVYAPPLVELAPGLECFIFIVVRSECGLCVVGLRCCGRDAHARGAHVARVVPWNRNPFVGGLVGLLRRESGGE
jgi:hypothetical protein